MSSAMPNPSFATPSEYLDQIRFAYALRRSEVVPSESEMMRLTEKDLGRHGFSLAEVTADPYGHVIREIRDAISGVFDNDYGVSLSEECAIGALEHPSVNARCFRSPEGHYAIVLHFGLMNLLHKHTKLLTAAMDPSAVVYCNRKPVDQLSPTELQAWATELGDLYRETGQVQGATVKLTPEASSSAAQMLWLGEAFVMGHEIGHMIAGHLEDRSSLVADVEVPWLWFLPERPLHEFEFEADEYGYLAMEASLPGAPKAVLLGGLIGTFATMSMIGGVQASPSHPSSLSRIHRLVALHFSSSTAELVRRWVEDDDEEAAMAALETAA
jgi:hypothetical protein